MELRAEFRQGTLYTKRGLKAKRFEVFFEPIVFYSAVLGREIVVPIGFKTDFASIPWFLQSLIQVNGPHIQAAVVHDFLCIYKDAFKITQKQADEVFLEAMECIGVRYTQRTVMFWGVRGYQATKEMIFG